MNEFVKLSPWCRHNGKQIWIAVGHLRVAINRCFYGTFTISQLQCLLLNIIFILNGTNLVWHHKCYIWNVLLATSVQWWKSHNVTAAFVRFYDILPQHWKIYFDIWKIYFRMEFSYYMEKCFLVSYFLLILIDFDISWKMWRSREFCCEKLINPLLTFFKDTKIPYMEGNVFTNYSVWVLYPSQ
jgi:hypothetical protein